VIFFNKKKMNVVIQLWHVYMLNGFGSHSQKLAQKHAREVCNLKKVLYGLKQARLFVTFVIY